MIQIKIVNKTNELPKYKTIGSSGLDLRIDLCEENITKYRTQGFRAYSATNTEKAYIELVATQRVLLYTGISIELPENMEAQIRSRSELALKEGLVVLNSPGTIDSDYRNEISVILINHGHYVKKIEDGDKIAQLIFNKIEKIEWNEVHQLSNNT